MIRNYCGKIVFPENFVYNNTMAQHYDNPAKYIMLEHSQEFAEFMVGQSVLEMQTPGLLPFTPLMKPPEGVDPNRWLEKCVDVTVSARTDQHTRDTLLAALGIFGGLVYEPQMEEWQLTRRTPLQHVSKGGKCGIW